MKVEPRTETRGRKPVYDAAAVQDRIIDLILNDTTISLLDICKMQGMPSPFTVHTWVAKDHLGFKARYHEAKQLQAAAGAEEIIAIADDGSRDYKQNSEGHYVPDHDHISRSKLRVSARQWRAEKLLPKIYGTKVDVTSDGEKVQFAPINIPALEKPRSE